MKKLFILLILACLGWNQTNAQDVVTSFTDWNYETSSNYAQVTESECAKTIILTSSASFMNGTDDDCQPGAYFMDIPSGAQITINFIEPVLNPRLLICDIESNESLIDITPVPSSVTSPYSLSGNVVSSSANDQGNNNSGWIMWTGAVSTITFTYNNTQHNKRSITLVKLAFDCICCSGKSNKTNLTSNFTEESNISANSIGPGEYGYLNGTEANTISSTWNVMDNSYCTPDDGGFYVFNGHTGEATEAVIAMINFDNPNQDDEFKFCLKAKNLNQCSFNVLPIIRIVYNGDEILQPTTIDTDSPPCEWTQISTSFTYVQGVDAVIIYLDQSGIGDGNDIAIDDIKAIPIQSCSGSADFNINSTPTPGDNSTISISISNIDMNSNCQNSSWKICQNNGSGQCVSGTEYTGWDGQNYPNFNGYQIDHYDANFENEPGLFNFGLPGYLITRILSGPCSSPKMLTKPAGIWKKKLKNGNTILIDQNGKLVTPKNANSPNSPSIQISPNPSTGNIQIHVENMEKVQGDVTVFSSLGDVVWEQSISNEATWNKTVSLNKNGVYTIKLNLGTKSIIKNVIISNK